MSSRILIASPQEASVITSEALAAAAEVHFGDRAEVVRQSESPVDLVVYVAPADGPPFSIAHFRDDRSVSVDGTPRQNAEVASWLRVVLPRGFPRLIAFDESWTRHVHRMVRDGLEGLSSGSDPGLRRLASAILDGEADVKELLTAPASAPILAAAAQRSREERSGLSPEQLAHLRESARRGAHEGMTTDG